MLDVGIAFFGGVAGIVAGSRKDKTNAIPGVAIATALMPPLCTAGFGIATMRTDYFLGAFYLYFINAVFISFATYLIVVWLGFPRYIRKETGSDPHIKASIVVFVALVVIPSGVIFYNVLNQLRFDRNVKNFVNRELRQDARQPIDWSVSGQNERKTLKVFVVGKPFAENEKRQLNGKLETDYNLKSLNLDLVQMNLSPDEITKATTAVETNLTDKLTLLQSTEDSQANEIENLKTEIEILRANTEREKVSLNDLLKLLFLSIAEVAVNSSAPENGDNSAEINHQVVVTFQKDVNSETKTEVLGKVERIARLKLRSQNVQTKEVISDENKPPENINANVKN